MIETIDKPRIGEKQKEEVEEVKLWNALLFLKDGRSILVDEPHDKPLIEKYLVALRRICDMHPNLPFGLGAETLFHGRDYSHGIPVPA